MLQETHLPVDELIFGKAPKNARFGAKGFYRFYRFHLFCVELGIGLGLGR